MEWALGNKAYDVIVGIAARRQASNTIYAVKTCRVVGAKILNIIPDPGPMASQQSATSYHNYYWWHAEDFLVRIESKYPNSAQEMSWHFTAVVMCMEDAPQCAEMLEHPGWPADSASVATEYHTSFEKECGFGEVLTSIYSEHLAEEEDRTFSFSCGEAPGLKLKECDWTEEDGKHLGGEWTLGTGEKVIVGLKSSAVRKDKKDRTYSIKSCKVDGPDMPQSVAGASWANEYGQKLSYTVQSTSFMTKIISRYSNHHRDRKFKFATVQLCMVGTDLESSKDPIPKTFEKNMALWKPSIYSQERIMRNTVQDVTRTEIPWVSFSDFADWNFSSRALLIPKQADKQLVLRFDTEVKMQSYVMAGGTLIVCGGGDFYTPFRGIYLLNRIFGLSIKKGPENGYKYGSEMTARSNETGCGIFCSMHTLTHMPWTTMIVNIDSLPREALVAFSFEDEVNKAATPVFTIPYGKGLIVYLGFDWWEASMEQRQPWADLVKLAYDRNA